MKVVEITNYLESLAPRSSQESYDNCGLLVGDRLAKGCNLIIAHHPVIFKGLKSLTGANYIERTILACIKNGIALYAIHTNLDNYSKGVNYEIGQRIGLKNLRVLQPKSNVLAKLIVFTPETCLEQVREAAFNAGAGSIGNYNECHFELNGTGTFKPNESANPFDGEVGKRSSVPESRLEFLVSTHLISQVLAAVKQAHPYDEVAYDIIPLLNENQTEGSGMIGELETEMDEISFLKHVKSTFNCGAIRHTNLLNRKIKTVAFCGGSGSFLLSTAMRQKADVYITGDFKYHEFFDAENQILIADIGHYESEQFTSNLIADILKKKFTTFAVHLTGINTNPINYF